MVYLRVDMMYLRVDMMYLIVDDVFNSRFSSDDVLIQDSRLHIVIILIL